MSFKKLNLNPKLLKTLERLNYTTPTEIQKRTIPLLLKGKDILATSQTGTGKTASFVLPILENLEESNRVKTGEERYQIDALILAPTRELVLQIHQKIEAYGENFTHTSVALYGGIKLGSQVKQIRAGANIAVATTGRLLEHIKNKTINLSKVKIIVLDEADKMLEMGFINEIRSIISQLPKEIGGRVRHSLMFSATFPKPIMSLAKSFLHHPSIIEIDRENLSTKNIKQLIHYVNEEEKIPLLAQFIRERDWHQVLIFTNTKSQANIIVENLNNSKIKSVAIHGDKSQGVRLEALKNFKIKKVRILVATDIASRGIDIIDLPYVINFELPLNNEDYVHRIGRTGRAGKEGVALSFICKKEMQQLKEIEKLINKKIDSIESESFTYQPDTEPSNRKKKKEDRKKGVNLKKAKALAEKMMGTKEMSNDNRAKKKKTKGEKPTNKRHF